ncbi:MAG: hypothetical protein J0I20_23545 [Chloroflexi bacterium]|nr:hypothetical protein [Chloroflexota bacterium]OJW04159.1 MAG: hypothetical protein BGO39_06685 [Chloroflexi bacterium 54-19]
MEPVYAFRFFFDWGSPSECLWPDNQAARARFGFAPSIEIFPVSPALKAEVIRVGEWYQTALNWDYPPDPGPWRQAECDRFNRGVRQLFDALGKELGPNFKLVYAQDEPAEDPDLDEYLKDPAHFKRKRLD